MNETEILAFVKYLSGWAMILYPMALVYAVRCKDVEPKHSSADCFKLAACLTFLAVVVLSGIRLLGL